MLSTYCFPRWFGCFNRQGILLGAGAPRFAKTLGVSSARPTESLFMSPLRTSARALPLDQAAAMERGGEGPLMAGSR